MRIRLLRLIRLRLVRLLRRLRLVRRRLLLRLVRLRGSATTLRGLLLGLGWVRRIDGALRLGGRLLLR